MSGHVFIYCDDPSHSKHVAVTNFHSAGGGRWYEPFTSARPTQGRDAAVVLVNDEPLAPDWREQYRRGELDGEVRIKYQLRCRKCPGRPVVAREENLFAVFDVLDASGESRITLATLAVKVAKQSENREQVGTDPEPGQG